MEKYILPRPREAREKFDRKFGVRSSEFGVNEKITKRRF
jgi:hypothetical protein